MLTPAHHSLAPVRESPKASRPVPVVGPNDCVVAGWACTCTGSSSTEAATRTRLRLEITRAGRICSRMSQYHGCTATAAKKQVAGSKGSRAVKTGVHVSICVIKSSGWANGTPLPSASCTNHGYIFASAACRDAVHVEVESSHQAPDMLDMANCTKRTSSHQSSNCLLVHLGNTYTRLKCASYASIPLVLATSSSNGRFKATRVRIYRVSP